jgi:hypothetical protein
LLHHRDAQCTPYLQANDIALYIGMRMGVNAICIFFAISLDSVPLRPRIKLVILLAIAFNMARSFYKIVFQEPYQIWFQNALQNWGFYVFDPQSSRTQSVFALFLFLVKYCVSVVLHPSSCVILRSPLVFDKY